MAKYVALDIGHGEDTWERTGGKGVKIDDLGGGRMEEHWFNSAVAIYAKELLERNGVKVLFGQEPYKNEIPLLTRTNLYNKEKVDLVFSIHANAGSHSASGACSFYWYTAKDSKKLSDTWVKYAKQYLEEVGLHGNGQHASQPNSWTNLHICRETDMTAILTENGFMTNDNDIKWLLDDGYRRDVAEVVARTICDFLCIAFDKKPADQPPKEEEIKDGQYKIKKGDTFWSIAQAFKDLTVEDLISMNPDVNYKALKVGQIINLKPAKKEGKAKYHTIVKGDTFWELAKKYKTTVNQLKKLNPKIKPEALEIGSKVKISDGEEVANDKPKENTKSKPKSKKDLPNTTYYVKSPMFHGEGVRQVQEALASVYFYPEKGAKNNGVDGWYGNKTADAVRRFQSMYGLKQDGIYGKNTRAKLLQVMK